MVVVVVVVVVVVGHAMGATKRKVAGSISGDTNGFFSFTKSFRPRCDPGVDLASNRNECQEYLQG